MVLKLKRDKRRFAPPLLAVLGSTASILACLVPAIAASAQSSFYDIQGFQNRACIENLAQRQIITGYPDGSFRPRSPVTRAQFAVMVSQAFPGVLQIRNPTQFVDVPLNNWAYSSIQKAYREGFLSGYPGHTFKPDWGISRSQVLVALVSGLGYSSSGSPTAILNASYRDANKIPAYARSAVAAASEQQLVASAGLLRPNQLAGRAEVASFLCQALAHPRRASVTPSHSSPLSP